MLRWLIVSLILIFIPCTGNAETELFMHQDRHIENLDNHLYLYSTDEGILSSAYDSIDPFYNGVSIVSREGRFGLLRDDGREILPCRYESISREDDCYVLGQINEKGLCYGLCDANGNLLVSPVYHELWYDHGLAAVTVNGPEGGAGMIDRTGKIIIPLRFEGIGLFQNGWAWVCEMGTQKYNFVNDRCEYLLDVSADDCQGFFGDFALIKYGEDCFVIKHDKSIYHKIAGNPVVYLGINDLFLIENEDGQYLYYADTDTYEHLGDIKVDWQGYNDGLIAVQDKTGKWGFMNESQRIIIPCIYDDVQTFSDNRTWAVLDQEYYFLDTEGVCHYTEKLTDASPYTDGLAAIRVDNRWGFINGNGEVVLAPSLQSDESVLRFVDGYCNLQQSDPFAATYIDKNFNIVTEYDIWDIMLDGDFGDA